MKKKKKKVRTHIAHGLFQNPNFGNAPNTQNDKMLMIQHDGSKFELGSTIATNAWVSTTILQNMRILF